MDGGGKSHGTRCLEAGKKKISCPISGMQATLYSLPDPQRSKWKIEMRRTLCQVDAMAALARANVLSLSIPERIQLAEEVWDTIAEVPEEVALTDEQKTKLDRRLDAHHLNPDEGSPWGVVRERIRSRR